MCIYTCTYIYIHTHVGAMGQMEHCIFERVPATAMQGFRVGFVHGFRRSTEMARDVPDAPWSDDQLAVAAASTRGPGGNTCR